MKTFEFEHSYPPTGFVSECCVRVVSAEAFGGNNYSGNWARGDDRSLMILSDGTQVIGPWSDSRKIPGDKPAEIKRMLLDKPGQTLADMFFDYPLEAMPARLITEVVAEAGSEKIYFLKNGELWLTPRT